MPKNVMPSLFRDLFSYQTFAPLFRLLSIPKELVFYMEQAASLDRTNLNTDYPELIEPDFHTYLPILIEEYCRTKA